MITKRIIGLLVTALASSSLDAATANNNPIIPKKAVASVQVKEGQTLYLISKSNQLTLRQLYKFNDFGPQADVLEPGTKVYLAQKKINSKRVCYSGSLHHTSSNFQSRRNSTEITDENESRFFSGRTTTERRKGIPSLTCMASEGICLLFVIKSRSSGLFSYIKGHFEQINSFAVLL